VAVLTPLAVVAAVSIAVAASAAPSPVRVDRDRGVRFDLEGSVLTVGLVGQTETSSELWGKRIRAVCSPTFGYRETLRVAVRGIQLWPAGQAELTYEFDRDISDRVKWCLLEDASGGDIADVQFEVFIAVHGASAKDRRIGRRLSEYLWRNAGAAPWLRQLRGIIFDHGVITVATQLRDQPRSKRIAREICGLIQGSDVADSTPGHTVTGRNDVVLKVCRADGATAGSRRP
jgi:hypothetical protein